jgi:PKD repeat protein
MKRSIKTISKLFISFRLLYVVLILLLIYNIALYSQSNFNFNNGNVQGWTTNGPRNTKGTYLSSNFSPLAWSDSTNYPNPIEADPIGELNGSVEFSCVEGTGIDDSDTWWIMQFVSPDLSTNPDWQNAEGYSIQLIENMSYPASEGGSTIYANLYVKVYDNDLGTVRYFYNGTAQPLIRNEWNSYSFTWDTIKTFPKNYILQGIFIDIWGTIADYYSGTVYLDEVNLILGQRLRILYPNGGENFLVGNDYNIQWSAIGFDTVNLEYSPDNGSSWNPIASGINAASGNYLWKIPNTPSSNCRVRITGFGSEIPYSDESDSAFAIVPPSTITVTAPNGGENWTVGSQYYITWTSTSVANVKIEYSINGGDNWEMIVPSIPASNGNFFWLVPNTITSQCLVKVSDVSNPSIYYDQSDAVFSIIQAPSINITSPNGGEDLTVGSPQYIIWMSSSSITYVKIEYSTDNGSNWRTIATNVFANSSPYSWVIPNTPSTQCLIKISDALFPSVFDVTDAVFKISPAQGITVASPNGGETWITGSVQIISWTSTTIANIKIEYSTNNGSSWNNIISSYAASSGTYSWLIPNTPSSQCLIKISDVSDVSIYDQSNDIFTINPAQGITVTSPNGGETWISGSTQVISWTSTSIANIKIEYSTDNGSNWNNIIASYAANNGTYTWLIPSTPSSQCLIRISDASNPQVSDQSNTIFTISSRSTISINSPNGGEDWVAGTTHSISWTSESVTNIKIEYSTNNGSNWINIISSTPANSGSYSWLIPNTPSSQYLVKISDVSNPLINDQSNTTFIISSAISPTISLTSPNGGENLIIGNVYIITWTSAYIDNIKIEYSTNNGSSWNNIISSYAASGGTYSWLIPNTLSTQCLVKISDASNASIYDQSNNVFTITIVQGINVTSPNGGEQWTVGYSYNIYWTKSTTVTNVKLEYSTNNGSNWTTIYSSIPATPENYSWLIPNTPSSQCLIKISDAANPEIFDVSDNVFTISSPFITVTLPTGGDIWIIGNEYTIQWQQNIPEVINIELFKGNNQVLIIAAPVYAVNAPYGTYQWTVPNELLPGTDYRIKILSSLTNNIYSFSDYFTINSPNIPVINVTSPNGGENWVIGTTQNITWASNAVTNVKIEYSTNNGTDWTTIISSTPAGNGTYSWLIPNSPSIQCLVKISDALNLDIFDKSDAVYTIIHPAPTANFEASPLIGLRPLTVNFTDLSTGDINTWQWKFGDGSESNQRNPEYVYNKSGTYSVELTVTGSGGRNSITRQNYIIVDSLTWEMPSTIIMGEVASIRASLPNYFKPIDYKLFYRMGGQSAYQSVDFNLQDNLIEAVIPPGFITIRGIEYYTRLSDGVSVITYPENNPETHPAVILVMQNNVIPAISFQSKKHDMVSVPLNLMNKDVISFLIDAYGEYDKINWRIFRWDNNSSSYSEYPDLNVKINPGIAFWLITKNGNSFKLADVNSINTSQPYTIRLEQGWNQIGDPFAFPVSWDTIKNSDLIQSGPISWNSEIEDYDDINQTILKPWKGYWVYNPTETEVILSVPPIEIINLPKKNIWDKLSTNEFVLQLKANSQSNARDYQNYVGMLNNAQEGTDKFDVLKPPPISDKLKLSIIYGEKEYAQNIVPVSNEGAYWDLKINSNLPEKNVQLELEKRSSLPEDFKIWFIDKNRLLSVPVTDDGLDIQLPKDGIGYYRIIIGKEEFAKQHSEQIPLVPFEYTLFQNYPNPFNSMTNISYNLQEKSQVLIEVYDILGRRIKILVNNEFQNPGTHKILWDGTTSFGDYISSGVYIYRIKANDFTNSKMMVLLK